jgi:hypothetical protein
MANVTLHGPDGAGPAPATTAPPMPSAPPPGAPRAVPQAPAGGPRMDEVTDARGRVLTVRHIGPLERMRIFKACGAANSRIEQYVGTATLAYAVAAIDGEPVSSPLNETQIEALVVRLGDDGIDAVARVMMERQGITEALLMEAGGDVQVALQMAAARRQAETVDAAKN